MLEIDFLIERNVQNGLRLSMMFIRQLAGFEFDSDILRQKRYLGH